MRRVLILSLTTAALALSGCSGGGGEGSLDSPSDKSSKPDKSEKSEKSEKITAADGDDYDACRDGTCEVEIRKSATLPLDEKEFDTKELKVTVSGGSVQVLAVYPDGGHGRASFGVGGGVNMNGLAFTSPMIDGDVAVVNMQYQG